MSSDVLTDQTKDRVWSELLDIARHIRYYEMLTNRYTKFNRLIKLALVAGTAFTVGSVVGEDIPTAVAFLGAAAILSATVVDFVFDWSTRGALSHAISLECCVIEKDFEYLWSEIQSGRVTESECHERVNQLTMRVIAAASQLSDTNSRINDEAQKAADRVVSDKWGTHERATA